MPLHCLTSEPIFYSPWSCPHLFFYSRRTVQVSITLGGKCLSPRPEAKVHQYKWCDSMIKEELWLAGCRSINFCMTWWVSSSFCSFCICTGSYAEPDCIIVRMHPLSQTPISSSCTLLHKLLFQIRRAIVLHWMSPNQSFLVVRLLDVTGLWKKYIQYAHKDG